LTKPVETKGGDQNGTLQTETEVETPVQGIRAVADIIYNDNKKVNDLSIQE